MVGGEKSSAESVWTHVCSLIHSPETDAKGVTSYESNVKGVTSYEAEGVCLVYGVGARAWCTHMHGYRVQPADPSPRHSRVGALTLSAVKGACLLLSAIVRCRRAGSKGSEGSDLGEGSESSEGLRVQR